MSVTGLHDGVLLVFHQRANGGLVAGKYRAQLVREVIAALVCLVALDQAQQFFLPGQVERPLFLHFLQQRMDLGVRQRFVESIQLLGDFLAGLGDDLNLALAVGRVGVQHHVAQRNGDGVGLR